MPTGVVESEFGAPAGGATLSRRWVTTSSGPTLSGVVAGPGRAGVVLVHDLGRSARSLDRVVTALAPAVAVDLPGHGRSSSGGPYAPRRAGRPLAEAVRSFAAGARLLVAVGGGAPTAVAAAVRLGSGGPRLVLVDALPGTVAARPWPWPSPEFDDAAAAARWWAAAFGAPGPLADAEARRELRDRPDGRWEWRHDLARPTGPTAADFDDPALRDALAGLAHPLLVRTPRGALTDHDAAWFASVGGEVVTADADPDDRPDDLAALLRTARTPETDHENRSTP